MRSGGFIRIGALIKCVIAAYAQVSVLEQQEPWKEHMRSFMDCRGAIQCGVLVLETGYGPRHYSHSRPRVHGLWPETGRFGTSRCLAPRDKAFPEKVFSCYGSLWFQKHEWRQHGWCAGVASASDFFQQVCALSEAPLAMMANGKRLDATLDQMAASLSSAGYPVWHVDPRDSQVYLSACRSNAGKWVLAPVGSFSNVCGAAAPVAPASPQEGTCVDNMHGPVCESDGECLGYSGCVRCANSGYCTCVNEDTGHC